MKYSIDNIRDVIKAHLSGEGLEVAVSLANAVLVTEEIIRQRSGDDIAAGAIKSLTDLSFALTRNPFWTAHGQSIGPVFAAAVTARLAAFQYYSDLPSTDDKTAAMAARNMLIEVIVAVAMNSADPGQSIAVGNRMRKHLMINLNVE